MKKVIFIVISIIIIGLGFFFGYKTFVDKKDNDNEPVTVKKLQIFDESKNDRNVAVMINNNHNAWPHAGLDKSYLNYEIIAEGGVTRIMAIFKGLDAMPEKVGSIRSSRPYFLDYVLENDAIYVHWGGSEDAYKDISSLSLNSLDGINYEGKYFYREDLPDKAYEHTGFTKGSLIKKGVSTLGYRTTTNDKTVLSYSIDSIDLDTFENSIKADEVIIDYSSYHATKYIYDEENKVYLRSMKTSYGDYEDHTDADTGKQYSAKNIITYQVQNISYDSYGRQKLYNTGSGEGYFITNGYATKITWEKSSRSSKTIYKYKETGEEIKVNDGNTWIHIQPVNRDLSITSNSIESNE